MPLNLTKENIELLWLIQPNLNNQELEIKKKFDNPILSIEVNDLMYLTISSDFDYIYKLNPTSSSYRGNSTFFVFKVSSSTQSTQDFLVLKLNENIESSTLDSFMCFLLDYTDLIDLESASFKNETLKKIFQQFKNKETCKFSKEEEANKQDVLNSINFHRQAYVDKDTADMIANGSQAVGNGIVSLAKMASNLIETIGTQVADSVEQHNKKDDEEMETDSGSGSETSASDCSESGGDDEKAVEGAITQTISSPLSSAPMPSAPSAPSNADHHSSKHHSKRGHKHSRHSRKHSRRDREDGEEDEESNRSSRRHRRHRRRAANIKKLNQFSKSFAQTASIAATAISSVITSTASYVVPAVEEYLPGVISSVTNYDEETSRKFVGQGLGYSTVALNAVSNIKDSVSESIFIIGGSVASQTTQIVKSKYGEEAAEQTSDVLETAGNAAKTYTTIKNCKKII